MLDRGVLLSLHPAMEPVMLQNSQLAALKVSHPSALGLEVGQSLQVGTDKNLWGLWSLWKYGPCELDLTPR